jgi:AAA ATPase domain
MAEKRSQHHAHEHDRTRHLTGVHAATWRSPFCISCRRADDAEWHPRSNDRLRVLGRSTLASRSEALYDGTLAPLVGRAEERDLLLHAWLQAKSGEGRVVLLSGEPGIGKSRLLVELEARLATEAHGSLRYFCSPLHQGSALHPIIARWEQDAGFARGDTDEERLCKLESVLAPDKLSPTDVALIAGMLGVSTGERYKQPDLSPPRRKERTLALLQRRLACLAQRQPVLMLFEDAHWADPSSLELVETLVHPAENPNSLWPVTPPAACPSSSSGTASPSWH